MSDTPMTDAELMASELERRAGQYDEYDWHSRAEILGAKMIRQLISDLSESRAELARVRQETLEEAALVCEQYRSAQVMSKYARMSECQAARNAAEQCGKLLRAMKEKK